VLSFKKQLKLELFLRHFEFEFESSHIGAFLGDIKLHKLHATLEKKDEFKDELPVFTWRH